MANQIRETWRRIQIAREAKLDLPAAMNPPATETSIDELAANLKCDIPEPFRESLLTHNGMDSRKDGLEIDCDESSHQGLTPMSIEAIEEHWLSDRQYQREAEAEGDEYCKKPEWIPVFIDPIEGETQIYLDTTDGTILHYYMPASDEVDAFRYPDYATFLAVLEHHIRENLWFEWGNGTDAKTPVESRTLNEAGIDQLMAADKQEAYIGLRNGDVVSLGADQKAILNSILDSFKPVKFCRTPGVQNPEYELMFHVGAAHYSIAVSIGPDEYLSYSNNNIQFTGGDVEKFKEIVNAIEN